MEPAIIAIVDYCVRLVAERTTELTVLLMLAAAWRWLMGLSLKCSFEQRIAESETRLRADIAPLIILGQGATYDVLEGNQHTYYPINGHAEVVVQSKDGRTIPLRVQFDTGMVTSWSET